MDKKINIKRERSSASSINTRKSTRKNSIDDEQNQEKRRSARLSSAQPSTSSETAHILPKRARNKLVTNSKNEENVVPKEGGVNNSGKTTNEKISIVTVGQPVFDNNEHIDSEKESSGDVRGVYTEDTSVKDGSDSMPSNDDSRRSNNAAIADLKSDEQMKKQEENPRKLGNHGTDCSVKLPPDSSLDSFTLPTQFRTTQIITKNRVLYVNPYLLVEHSGIVANVVDKSGPQCKIQLDFIDFDDIQSALRIFIRNPKTGARELLPSRHDRNFKSQLAKLERCSIFITSLKKLVDSKDTTDMSSDFDVMTPRIKSIHDYYLPSPFRTCRITASDARTVFVNIEMLKEYSKLLSDLVKSSDKTQYFLPQFSSLELIAAMNVMFRKARNGRFHSITLDNLEALYKCSSVFDCLSSMCDAFSESYCVEAMMDSDWSHLKKLLTIQAKRRAAGADNRGLLCSLVDKMANFMKGSSQILKKVQLSGIADIPMGVGSALLVSIVEKRNQIEDEEALELIS